MKIIIGVEVVFVIINKYKYILDIYVLILIDYNY